MNTVLQNTEILAIVATTTARAIGTITGVLPTVFVFSVTIGLGFLAFRWIFGAIRGRSGRY